MAIISWLRNLFGTLGAGHEAPPPPQDSKLIQDAREASQWAARRLWHLGYLTDFSLRSLREVDNFFDDNAPWGKLKPGSHLAESPGHYVFALGSYVGEVIRRHGDGAWVGEGPDHWGERLEVRLPGGNRIWPIQRVVARYRNGPEDGIYLYGMAVLDRLDQVKFDDLRSRAPDDRKETE